MIYFPMILRANKFGQTLYTLNDKIAIWLLSDIGLGGATFSHTIIMKKVESSLCGSAKFSNDNLPYGRRRLCPHGSAKGKDKWMVGIVVGVKRKGLQHIP